MDFAQKSYLTKGQEMVKKGTIALQIRNANVESRYKVTSKAIVQAAQVSGNRLKPLVVEYRNWPT
jgi:hypothetical protein